MNQVYSLQKVSTIWAKSPPAYRKTEMLDPFDKSHLIDNSNNWNISVQIGFLLLGKNLELSEIVKSGEKRRGSHYPVHFFSKSFYT